MTGDLEAALAEVVAGSAEAPVPPAVAESARIFVLDSLAVGAAGTSRPDAPEILRAARRWGDAAEASSFLGGAPLPAPTAAFINAFLIHGLEYDAVHEGAVVHAMAAPLSAGLALAGRAARTGRPVGGAALIRALALGVDLAVALGLAARGPMRFFRPATASAFGATATAACLLGLDARTAGAALGLTLGQVAGTLQAHHEGSALLPLQMGFAARAALQSVDLATAGIDGPRHWLTGRYGYLALFEGGETDRSPLEALAHAERPWRLRELSHKPFPSGRLTHGAIDALGRLQAEHGFAADQVEHIQVIVPPLVEQLVGRPLVEPMDAAYARLCLAFCGACRLARGQVDVPEFTPPVLHDPAVLSLGRKVLIECDPTPSPTAILPQTVTVRLTDGRTLRVTLERNLGSPAAPLDEALRLDKVRRCLSHARAHGGALPADRLIERVAGLDDLDDAAALLP